MDFLTVTAVQLVELIKEQSSKYLIIDCRSFLTFNKGHISSALNIRCNSIMRRRSQGHFALENAITNCERRQDFVSGKTSTVILYDDQSEEINTKEIAPLKSRRTMNMVMETLQLSATSSTNICSLSCGFKEFYDEFPKHCEGSTRKPSLSTACEQQTIVSATPSTLLTPVYDQGTPVEILPHLYLGSAHHASQKSQLKALGITAILNASSTCPNHFDGDFQYTRIPVEDNCQADLSVWFNSAIGYINNVKDNGGKAFVHCHAGVSRSATICLAYLITCHNVSLSDAFRYVKQRRKVISPNFNFMGQLLKLENDIAEKKEQSEKKEQRAFDFKIPTNTAAIPEEMEWQDENSPTNTTNFALLGQSQSKLYQRRVSASTTPLTAVNSQSYHERPRLRSLTAPARPKDIVFFPEVNRSCSQQSSKVNPHRHSRAVTLST